MQTKVKRGDLFLILFILALAGIFFVIHQCKNQEDAAVVLVRVDGKEEGRYSLEQDQTIEIQGGSNILEIKNKKANMIQADCPDLLCVKQRAISKKGDSIICLPNKVVVSIEKGEDSGYDSISQ